MPRHQRNRQSLLISSQTSIATEVPETSADPKPAIQKKDNVQNLTQRQEQPKYSSYKLNGKNEVKLIETMTPKTETISITLTNQKVTEALSVRTDVSPTNRKSKTSTTIPTIDIVSVEPESEKMTEQVIGLDKMSTPIDSDQQQSTGDWILSKLVISSLKFKFQS